MWPRLSGWRSRPVWPQFGGTIDCQPSDVGTRVTQAYEFRFKGPFRLVERALAGWLQCEIETELSELAKRF